MSRLIDADEMKIKGYMRLSGYTVTNRLIDEVVDSVPTVKAIPIPDNATNGDVIKTMFPNAHIEYWAEYSTYNVEFPTDNDVKHFSYDWWNAPYKGSDKE